MPQPLQPALPEVAVSSSKQDASSPVIQMQTYFDRMMKMMMTMDDRLTRLESLMSHNLYLLHQQQQQQQLQQQQQQLQQAQPKKTQEEDLESALKEQVRSELEELKKVQAQYEKDSEIAKKIQEQMDSDYFNEEKKKFYTQPAAPVARQQISRPRIPGMEECPLCQNQFKLSELEAHVYACLDGENNVNSEGKAKVVDKPGFLARLFGSKKEVPEDKIPLMGSPHPSGHQSEYPGHPGGMYPMPYHAPMYPPMPTSPYIHGAPSQPPPQYYYYMPQHNQTA
jgi:ATP-dependent Lon protease